MSSETGYCPKCGAAKEPGAAFCSKCGTSFATGTTPTPPYASRHEWTRERQRQEKNEKGEKQEKGSGDLRGPLTGGGIFIWLGVLIYLEQARIIPGGDFGGLFLVGIGVLLILCGVTGKTTTGRPLMGFIIGGTIAALIGLASLRGFGVLGPFIGTIIFIGLGLLVILSAINARRRSPPPTSPAKSM